MSNRGMTWATRFIPALVVMFVVACEGSASSEPGPVTVTFDGNKKLELFAGYTLGSASIAITALADVPAGTQGTIEMTGSPFHVMCAGQFQRPDPGFQDPDNLSYLDVGAGHAGAFFGAPPGNYTAIARISSNGALVKKSFTAGQSFPDGQTGVFNLPLGCVPVADTKEQLAALLPKYVSAVETMVAKVDVSTVKSELSDLAARARNAVAAGDNSTAISALGRIRDIVAPFQARNPYYDILLNARAALALLTQTPPST
jgi:hypothetical protein